MDVSIKNKNWFLYLSLFLIIFFSFSILKPQIAGDGIDYVESMDFLSTGYRSPDFSPNRLLTTFGGLQTIIGLSKVFHSVVFSWIFLNAVLYFFFNFLFYKIVLSIHKDEKVALLATLFLAGNYAIIVFGLNFLMDMGGWFFYMVSIYLTLRYLETGARKNIIFSAFSVGVGLLFKEYAVLGVVPIAIVLIYENFYVGSFVLSLKNILKNSLYPALLALFPISLVYLFVYMQFDYTYLDWLQTNNERYDTFNKFSEYTKVYGSLLNILGVLFILGSYHLFSQWKGIDKKMKIYILGLVLSVTPLFVWPGITQRVLFMSVPAIVVISSYSIKRFYNKLWFFWVIFFVYFLINLFMDSYVLSYINLPF